MTKYEKLLQLAKDKGIEVKENVYFDSGLKGLAISEGVGLSYTLHTETEKRCILAEEIAHKEYNTGNITDLRIGSNRKQELRAHRQAVHELVPFEILIEVVIELRENATLFTIAETLDITEEFLLDALEIYRREYGPVSDFGSYLVVFDPFHIVERQHYYT